MHWPSGIQKKAKAGCKSTRIRSTGNGFHDDLDGCGHQPLANMCRCAVLCNYFVRYRPWPKFAPAINTYTLSTFLFTRIKGCSESLFVQGASPRWIRKSQQERHRVIAVIWNTMMRGYVTRLLCSATRNLECYMVVLHVNPAQLPRVPALAYDLTQLP